MSPFARLLRLPVHVYRWTLKPVLGTQCRFHPTCSQYALDALAVHGGWRGSGLALWRILRCNPWNADCGLDPVPPAATAAGAVHRQGGVTPPERV